MTSIPLSMDADMVRQHIRTKMKVLGVNQREYAEIYCYSEQYLSDFLNGKRNPGKKILAAEGFVAVTTYYEYER